MESSGGYPVWGEAVFLAGRWRRGSPLDQGRARAVEHHVADTPPPSKDAVLTTARITACHPCRSGLHPIWIRNSHRFRHLDASAARVRPPATRPTPLHRLSPLQRRIPDRRILAPLSMVHESCRTLDLLPHAAQELARRWAGPATGAAALRASHRSVRSPPAPPTSERSLGALCRRDLPPTQPLSSPAHAGVRNRFRGGRRHGARPSRCSLLKERAIQPWRRTTRCGPSLRHRAPRSQSRPPIFKRSHTWTKGLPWRWRRAPPTSLAAGACTRKRV